MCTRNQVVRQVIRKRDLTDMLTGWEDISITLSQADPNFGKTGNWAFGATGGKMSTTDGGKTWNFTTLYVPETRDR
jgi:hypothetical protein